MCTTMQEVQYKRKAGRPRKRPPDFFLRQTCALVGIGKKQFEAILKEWNNPPAHVAPGAQQLSAPKTSKGNR